MPHAIQYTEFGGPEVLQLTDVDLPSPGPGEVRVAVRAASVNVFDVKFRQGLFGATTFPVTPGVDMAGVVDAVGAGSEWSVGEDVFGNAKGGSYAEYTRATNLVAKPESVSWELAASLPTVGEAAARSLRLLVVTAGETLLIHGAAGSVGSIATQLAVSRGIQVIGSDGEAQADLIRELGGTPVTYGDGLADRVRAISPSGVHAVLDTTGAGVLPVSIELAGGPDRVITLADNDAAEYGVRFSSGGADYDHTALATLAELTATDSLQLPIWRTYPLAEAATAHDDVEQRRNRGKIVLIP
jgi:NADPH:quinone reductase-like Zn-dependent oxidoreductase